MFGLDIVGGLLSSAPEVPPWKNVNLPQQQQKAVGANTAILPQAEELAGRTNLFNAQQLEKMLASTIPGYGDLKAGVSGNIESLLKGEVPKDVQDQIASATAGRSLEGGYGGTGMGRNLLARDLGLTSLSLIEKGMDTAQNWIRTMGSLTTPHMFDVSSMFITPGQQFEATFQNQQARFGRDWLQSQIDSAHQPNNIIGASLIKTDEELAQIVASAAGSLGGAAIACWVAREVYGTSNIRWIMFRSWLFEDAPTWFRALYLKFGSRVAMWLKTMPRTKSLIRRWMDSRIRKKYARYL